MSFLRELHNMTSDAATDKRIADLIHFNARMSKISKFSDEDVVKLLKLVRDSDKEGITKGLSDEALKNVIKLHHVPTLESVEDEGEEEPREIAKGGDYVVVLLPDEQIMLRDAKHAKNIVQMPLVVWKQLCRQ